MSTRASVGESTLEDSRAAGRAAAEAACADLPGEANLCLVFGTAAYDQEELLAGVASAAPRAAISGCSAEGVIGPGWSCEGEHAVSILALCSDRLHFESVSVEAYGNEPARAGAELARLLNARPCDDAVGLLVFPDGTAGDCTAFLNALHQELAASLPIAGGAASDDFTFQRTWQYHRDQVGSGSVSAVRIRGRGRMELAVSHGCHPIGLARQVTSAGGGWMREIDGRPAWSVFKEYLDGEPEDLNAEGIAHLCVGLPLDEEAGQYVIRAPLALDKSSGALFFPGGGIEPKGSIRLTRRDRGQIRESALSCARSIQERSAGRAPTCVLQFDCAGRGRVLFGSRAPEEIVKPLQEVLGPRTPWVGFHTYGEIASVPDGLPRYHNYTVVLCALFDDE